MLNILDKESLESTIQEYARISDNIWYKHSQCVNITKNPKLGEMRIVKLVLRSTCY